MMRSNARTLMFAMVAAGTWAIGPTPVRGQDGGPATGRPDARRPIQEESRQPPGPQAQQGGARRPIIPDDVQIVSNVVYATIETSEGEPIHLTMDVAFPRAHDNEPLPAVVLIHGGGYSAGSKRMYSDLIVPLAQGGYLAATIDYRLSGVAPYPAAVHDCKAAVRFLRANAQDLGIDPQRIGVLGHSAGGHLSALLAVTGNAPELEGSVGATDVSSAVQCAVNLSGPVDFVLLEQQRGERSVLFDEWFAGDPQAFQDRLRQAGPVMHADSADPPILIVHGEADQVVEILHAELLRDALVEVNVEHEYMAVEGAGHSLSGPAVFSAVAGFLDRHLGGHAANVLRPMGSGAAIGGTQRRPVPDDARTPPGSGAAGPSRTTEPKKPEQPEPPSDPDDDEPMENAVLLSAAPRSFPGARTRAQRHRSA